jgi:hypothetical protein
MRWSSANLEEKQEPRAATSASAEQHAEGMRHDVTRKTLTEAAIEKQTLRAEVRKDFKLRHSCPLGLLDAPKAAV